MAPEKRNKILFVENGYFGNFLSKWVFFTIIGDIENVVSGNAR